MAKTVDPYYEWLGIPPRDQPPNHYRLLGLESFEQNRSVIDAAANRQMSFVKEYQAGEDSDLSQKLLNELSAARLCLLNPEKKAAYDAQLRAALGAQPTAPPPALPAAEGRWRSEQLPPPDSRTASAKTDPPLRDPIPMPAPLTGQSTAPVTVDVRGKRPPRSNTRNWMMLAAAGVVVAAAALVLGFIVAPALFPPREIPDQAVVKRTQQPAAEVLPGPAMPPPASPETSESAEPEPVPSPSESEPTVSPPEPPVSPPVADPPEEPPAPSPTPVVAETSEQAEARLQSAAERASLPADHHAVAHEALLLADRAVLDSQGEPAKRFALLALRAARSAQLDREARDATLLLIDLNEPLTEAARDRARQRLSEREKLPLGSSQTQRKSADYGDKKILLILPRREPEVALEACRQYGLAYETAPSFDMHRSDYAAYHTIMAGTNIMDYWGGEETKKPEAFQHVEAFVNQGGHLMVLGAFNGRNNEHMQRFGIHTGFHHNRSFERAGRATDFLFLGNERIVPEDQSLRSSGHFSCSAPHTVLLKRGSGSYEGQPALITLPHNKGRVTFTLVQPEYQGDYWLITVLISWIARGCPT